jgi:hypothetical protein
MAASKTFGKRAAPTDEYEDEPEEETDDQPEDGQEDNEEDGLSVCGRAIREAMASGDDRAIGDAVKSAVRMYAGAGEDDEEDEPDGDEGGKPNLAILLTGKGKKGSKED